LQKFTVKGILNFGRKDYDDRYVMTDLKTAQEFGELSENISGWRVKVRDFRQATELQQRLEAALGPSYRVLTWIDSNRNLFQAVKYEKAVIFVIVFLMVVAAAFNVSSALFVNVVKRFRAISIMRAVGANAGFIRTLFTIQ